MLALSSADAATIGAAATQLRAALHITNTDIGLLVAVNSLVGAVASFPFGVLADRAKRTRILGASIVVWGLAMLWSAAVSSFGQLLLARVFLGLVTASAGPIVASLIGDYFLGSERGKIYSYVLTGELLGSGIGFAISGDIAALSWRAAFVSLAIPAFVLARYVLALPEPARGATQPLLGASNVAVATEPVGAPVEEAGGHEPDNEGPGKDGGPARTVPTRRRPNGWPASGGCAPTRIWSSAPRPDPWGPSPRPATSCGYPPM